MKYIISIILLGLGITGLVGGLFFSKYFIEIFLGMAAPMVVSIFSIQLIKRAHAASPEKLTATLTKSFFSKMVLVALYLIIIIRELHKQVFLQKN